MAIAKVADRGSTANTTSNQSATTVTVTGTVAVGNVLIARIAADNSGSAGAAPGLSVSGSAGNTWVVLGPVLNDPGAASAGIAGYLCYAVVTNQLVNGDTISFDWVSPVTAKAIVVEEWSGIDTDNPVAVAAVTATGSTTAPSRTITPTAAGQLVYAMLAVEGGTADTFTNDTDTLNGSWVALTRAGAGTTTSGATINGQYKIVTASGAQTWNPTVTARDWGALGVVFAAGIPPTAKTGTDDPLNIALTEGTPDIVKLSAITEDFEDASFIFNIVSGTWIRTSTQAHGGTWSWTNDDITDGQTTDMVVTIPEGATSVSFWYRVSSEASWDYFRFFIDGVQQFQASGTVAWTQSADYDLTGKTQLTFRYMKDSSQSVGEDSAYVDDIVFMGSFGPPPIVITGTDDPLNISLTGTASVATGLGQQLFPDAILTQTNLTGAVTDIDEDPDSPDASWLTGGGAVVLRVSFPSPSSNLVPGFPQEFRVRVRPGT